ncbi:MAG: 3'-5' exonuclease domain-containing protein 2 [Betaproteobacteria bacterium]|nr:3'-5' exonuclease domain-containing protein 2 [Betaproteobacteria bacterium]MDH4294500.1 3'-5' exonuclease domain-containing protein 2 [Betaproteobacteria bacterium]MDH5342134.1 3'-5' exonuclease domain-containing protein 2 [Betaproteobacteria bacterium]
MTRQTTDTRHDDRARAISRADLNELPVRRYEGPVAFVDTPDILAAAAADIRSERVTGFDTETRPAFSKGESYLPSLVQVATAKCVYLFPLRLQETHAVIAGLLQAPATVKAGVALAYDLRTLNQVFRFAEKSVIDLGVVAKRNDYEQTGVRNLAGIFLGYRIPKGAKTTNWAAPRLTPAQITYAATDAWVSRELYLQFEDAGLLP